MESFLEANRIVESSLVKLNRFRSDMPLRKALFVTNVMTRAQEVAECAHISFMNSSACPTRPSKLLASMRAGTEMVEDTAVSLIETDARQSSCKSKTTVSPVALTHVSAVKEQDEVMDFISNSVLSDILNDEDSDMEVIPPSKLSTWSPLSDVSNTLEWPSWTKPSLKLDHWVVSEDREPSSPPSPGKRQHNIAFPGNEHDNQSTVSTDLRKRFKSSLPQDMHTLSSSSMGFCEYLYSRSDLSCMFDSSKTFMATKDSSWPVSGFSESRLESTIMSSSKLYPVLAY